ncbi:MAG: cyclic beta 1-2 glucan synthetase, partial [Planctomycetota bacterium]
EQLIRLAQKGIQRLNDKYAGDTNNIFFLFHRPRLWNQQEQVWMGYERKRGKIEDLNALLRDTGPQNRFSLIVGDISILRTVKYVITLDTDTQLPRDAARLLAEAIAHPLNRPQFDPKKKLVTQGYTIIQPRVEASMSAASRSLFSQLFGGEPGIDPYTLAVSDVYQDVFCEGSFIGKGIYDIDVFMQVMNNRLPENLILSHDLLEGCYTRTALASDICLYEEYPDNYIADTSRRHRWIRGDWQIIRWLFSRVPAAGKTSQKNPLSIVSQWKILDNLRRSLVPFALISLLILGWVILEPAWLSLVLVIGIIMISPLLTAATELFCKPRNLPLGLHLHTAINSILRHFAQSCLVIIFLPYETFSSLDAIIRSLLRITLTGKHLLKWVTFSQQTRVGRTNLAGHYQKMWIAPFLAIAVLIYLIARRPEALAMTMPLLLIWFAAPVFAWRLGKPITRKQSKLTDEQSIFLRKLSRKIWSYFEVFVGPENNWLPVDNYQEGAVEIAARRTSPTNMGISLMANLAAYDFGYIPIGQLIQRITAQMQTMEKLERFQGHFYNWYDTQSLKPLNPLYISTVDSGNLAGYLLTLKSGLAQFPNNRIISSRAFDGIADALSVLSDISGQPDEPAEKHQAALISASLRQLQNKLKEKPQTLTSARTLLNQIQTITADIKKNTENDAGDELKVWVNALDQQVRNILEDMTLSAPWILILEPAEDKRRQLTSGQANLPEDLRQALSQLDNIPTLREITKLDSYLLPKIDSVINSFITGSHAVTASYPSGVFVESPTGRACSDPQPAEAGRSTNNNDSTIKIWLINLRQALSDAQSRAIEQNDNIDKLILQCTAFMDMDYDLLYDKARNLMIIGYNVSEHRRDNSYYDLLASESRQCSFVAIAQGKLPQKHWFALGRLLTSVDGQQVLLSPRKPGRRIIYRLVKTVASLESLCVHSLQVDARFLRRDH